MNAIQIIKNGIVKENPTFVLMLGMCPTLATTTSAMNGMSMGVATMVVLICTNFVISCLKSITPDKVRIPVFIVVIAAFVTILQLVIKAFLPDIDAALGLFIPLIVVNCVILGRAEAFAAKNSPCWASVVRFWVLALSSASRCCLRPTTSCSSCSLRGLSLCWDSSSLSLTKSEVKLWSIF